MFLKLHNIFKRTNKLLIYRFNHNYIYKMDKAYLRHVSEENAEDKFQITFQYKNEEQNVDRQFNFVRQLAETVDTFLSRVTTNVDKVINKKKKKKKYDTTLEVEETINVELLLNNEKVANDMICRDLFQDDNNVVLSITDKKYQILINAPYIDNIALPSCMLANFPVHPSKFESVYTDKRLSDFLWFSSIDKKEWESIGTGFAFTPTNSEINHFIKLCCVPKNGYMEGPMIEICSDVTVSAGPGLCPFENRQLFTKDKCKNDEFRVVTYNILADLYCDSEYTRTVLHPYCPPYALAIDYRKQLFIKEIIGYNSDIICLQEVDRKVYNYDLEPVLSNLDYESHFQLKGGTVAEGLACFYNAKRFTLLEKCGIVLSNHIKTDPIYAHILQTISTNEKLLERVLERMTATQITVVESTENGNILLIANTHLYFHPDADHIRLLQAGVSMKFVENTYNNLKLKYPNKSIGIIFCGDFNSVPECGIFKLFTTGHVGHDCIDWESNKEEAVKNLTLTQPFALDTACGTPKYTNFTSDFADCLDYIFYDKNVMAVSQVIPLPSDEVLKQNVALPSIVFPSDHVSLVADLKWLK